MAEAVFQAQVKQRNPEIQGKIVKIDSCGTGAYHVGDDPDERTVQTCQKHKIPINSVARALSKEDFHEFTHILAMDQMNLRNINNVRPANSQAIVSLFSAFDPTSTSTTTKSKPVDIVDPYYGSGMSGFERCYKQCVDYSNGFLDQLEAGELEVPVDRRKVKKAGL
ncbi:hypothetical protein FFLO_02115 [Filobasidium floriforme]|uniref:Phosphotyrosine protein phosphatase I domain-containing protein n=1 Tax=Filobasidium floriforme TaxID=5210 RepID=A0A8K0NRM6_9TREE|nr:hypothetical protein FFLO_02115 [Filobasidium floriforme]